MAITIENRFPSDVTHGRDSAIEVLQDFLTEHMNQPDAKGEIIGQHGLTKSDVAFIEDGGNGFKVVTRSSNIFSVLVNDFIMFCYFNEEQIEDGQLKGSWIIIDKEPDGFAIK